MTEDRNKQKAPSPAVPDDFKIAKRSFYRSLILLGLGLVYWISPVDIIPDVLIGPGYIDDAAAMGVTFLNSSYRYWKMTRAVRKGEKKQG